MSSEIPGVFDTPDILNLHYFKRDSYIDKLMSGRHCAAEDSGLFAVTHLAVARSQNSGTGILGLTEDKKAALAAFFWLK